MPTLQEKIEANARQRLSLPRHRTPSEELKRYRDFLKVENHRLKILHRAGSGGRMVCRTRALVMDQLLIHLLEAAQATAGFGEPRAPMALVALGGYGRRELNPHSDIDFMFLHDGEAAAIARSGSFMSKLTDAFLYPLWDIGLKVGHSVRSVEDCVRAANTNVQSKTSLIEARLVMGDAALFQRMQANVLARCVRGMEKEYIEARVADQEGRRAKYGNSACMQEPHIKNGCGGLRDYQNLFWMAFFKYRISSLGELQERDLITRAELKSLYAAYDFLLRVRTELHYHVDRPSDVLSKNLQPTVAHYLEYADRSPRRRLEHLMRDVYLHMRNIFLITRTVEQRLAIFPAPRRLASLLDILPGRRKLEAAQQVDGFKIASDAVLPISSRVFKEQPRRLMRVFLYAQQRGLPLHPDLAQLIRNQLALVDRSFLRDEHIQQSFLEILNQRGNVAPVLRAMHEVGLLGKYLPEFGRLTCLVQHEFYHRYTADEHTLVCIEKLDRVWGAQSPPYNRYEELFIQLERPYVLYLALLLHDAGKASSQGDHCQSSSRLAAQLARRLSLDDSVTHSLCLVIEKHLLMAQISQRHDLDDPAVIRNFAAQVENTENLSLLTLHTFADSMGTSEELWNGFKDSLLWSLHDKARALLEGASEFVAVEQRERDLLLDEIRRRLPRSFSDEEVAAHFQNLPARYFRAHTPRQIISHLVLAHRFMELQVSDEERALEPVLRWRNEPDRGYSSVTVCTWDRHGLFSKIAGSLTAAGLNILTAQIHTRSDGFILDTFFVTDAKTGLLANRAEKEEFGRILRDVLAHGADVGELLARPPKARPRFQHYESEPIPTRIRFDNDISDEFTVIEVETEDQVGLLYVISHTLAELAININLAKILTEKGAAVDSFYVTDWDLQKIVSDADQERTAAAIRAAIAGIRSAGRNSS